jgi:hypothetical protein
MGEQMLNNEVEEGYINVTSHRTADAYQTSDGRQVSASTSSTSATSSHLIHTREPTTEYTSAARVSSSQDASDIRRLQSENEWLYDWNAELQDNVEKLKAEASSKEREYRHTTRRLQTQVDTLQNALDEAERQNRSLEATIKHLWNQRSAEGRGGGIQVVRHQEAFRGYTHLRSDPIGGIPASSSAADSLGTISSADSVVNLYSGTQESERDLAETHQNLGQTGIRRVRKKVSWQDEINPSATLLSRPAPPPISLPSVGLPVAGIMKASQTNLHDRSPPRSPPSLQAYHLTPALPSVSEWVRTHPGGQRSQRRASDTPSPGPVKSLFEELKGAGQLLPSVSQGSSMSGHSTMRNPMDVTLAGSESGGGGQHEMNPSDDQEIEAENSDDDPTPTFRTVKPKEHDTTIIARCTAVIEERGNDFWQRVQFYCVVGIFLAGVLSKGRDGVMELGRRR